MTDTRKPKKTVANHPSEKRRALLTRMAVDDRQVDLAGIRNRVDRNRGGAPDGSPARAR